MLATAPGAKLSATIAAFSAALQRRRRGVPVSTSTRRKLCPSIGKLLGKPASLSRINETGSSVRPQPPQDGDSAPLSVNEYVNYPAGYFALLIIDECRRSIYGKWRRVLDHFDAIKIGLTSTPCVMPDAPDIDKEDRVTIRDTLRFFEVEHSTFIYTMAEAIADGRLGP